MDRSDFVFLGLAFAMVVSLAFFGCGKADGAGTAVILMQTAPDGSQCYVVYSGGEARGVSCR